MKKIRCVVQLIIIALIVFLLDQYSKKKVFYALEHSDKGIIEVIPRIVQFEIVTNTGGLWGILEGKNKIITIINIIVFPSLFVLFYNFIFLSFFSRIALGFIVGGALGNILDRIIYGYVRDFIHITIINYPIFNVADIFISFGAIFTMICIWKQSK